MTDTWMEAPDLIAWFDDLEHAVTAAMALTIEQRSQVSAQVAPRADTWVLCARDPARRDSLRDRLSEAQHHVSIPVARDCKVLPWRDTFVGEEDPFETANGFHEVAVDYIEEGSIEDVRRELLDDAGDYAASAETGWFYSVSDDACDNDPYGVA